MKRVYLEYSKNIQKENIPLSPSSKLTDTQSKI